MRIAYVRWFDSSITYGEPFTADQAHGVMENESAGLLVRQDDDSVTLALGRCTTNGNLRFAICIPRVNVRHMRTFDVPDSEIRQP